QARWSSGLITRYAFSVSGDGTNWTAVETAEFANIKNNPVWQIRRFAPMEARFVKLTALANAEGDQRVGYAEVDVISMTDAREKTLP
ncbi:MAG TPA: discoidin domain-containing protein, partial [Opitutaceae bacterium]|nr:discoidin domain-containing protein [Opitutaceae bacterium]